MIRTTTGRGARRLAGMITGLVAVACWPVQGYSAPAAPIVTILDGTATVLDGVRRTSAAPGQRLADGAIVETGAATQVLRIEWADGQAVNLGPGTRLMLNPPGFARRGHGGPALYLLQGWVKQHSPPGAQAQGLATRLFELAPFQGVVVVRAEAQDSWVFVQAGSAALTERQVKPAARHELATGNLFAATGTAGGTLQPRASSAQLQQVPRAFRDTLPARYAQASAAPATPEALPAPRYADLQPWLSAETPVRAGFTRRFGPLLRDRAFRRELDAHLADHAEWRPILHPPPPPPPPPPAASGVVYGSPAR